MSLDLDARQRAMLAEMGCGCGGPNRRRRRSRPQTLLKR